MKIGIVTQNFYPRLGGMEHATFLLASSLAQRDDLSIAVACSAMPEVPRNYAYPFPVHRHKSLSVLTPFMCRKNLSDMICLHRTELLHGIGAAGGGAIALQAARKYGLPCIVHSHGSDVQVVENIGYGQLLDSKMKQKVFETLQAADAVIAVSSMNRNLLVQAGADPKKVHLIYNGCLYEEIGVVPFQDLRVELELERDDFVLLTVGRASPVKRLELLFEALSLLRGHKPKIRCICVGPEKNLRSLARDYGIEDMIRPTGKIPSRLKDGETPPFMRLVNAYRTADLFVSSSYIESFGLGSLDAFACGRPVLFVGEKQGARDLAIEGMSGYTLWQETASALAGMLSERAGKRWEMKEFELQIRSSVANYSWSRIAETTAKFYRKILKH